MTLHTILEIISVICGFLYLWLMIRERIASWLFGIIGSAITIYLYVHVTLYLEAGLNFYYVLAGFYGWYYWNKHRNETKKTPVIDWKMGTQVTGIMICAALGVVLGYVMHQYTDSERPYIDAGITVFSFWATYMEARKVLSTWYYWFFLNAASIFLQIDRGLYYFSALSAFYTIMCISGYLQWKKSFQMQHRKSP